MYVNSCLSAPSSTFCLVMLQALQITLGFANRKGCREKEICCFLLASLDFTVCCSCGHHLKLAFSSQHLQFLPEAVNRIVCNFSTFAKPASMRAPQRQISTSPSVHYPQRSGSLHWAHTSTRWAMSSSSEVSSIRPILYAKGLLITTTFLCTLNPSSGGCFCSC